MKTNYLIAGAKDLLRPLSAILALSFIFLCSCSQQSACPAYGGKGDRANLAKSRTQSGLWDKHMKGPYSRRK